MTRSSFTSVERSSAGGCGALVNFGGDGPRSDMWAALTGWHARAAALIEDLALIDPDASIESISLSGVGPKVVYQSGKSAEAQVIIWSALEDLRRTCARCGHVETEAIVTRSKCEAGDRQ